MKKKELQQAFTEFVQQDVDEALTLITGMFVGLSVAYCELRGEEGDGEKNIRIRGDEDQRKITIHALDDDDQPEDINPQMLAALKEVRDDLIMRANFNGSNSPVQLGNTAWRNLNQTITSVDASDLSGEQRTALIPWCPDVCPITMRPFFMWIEHPDKGMVPTYGGPYDSYTIAQPDNISEARKATKWVDVEFTCSRYDHDSGCWEGEEDASIWPTIQDQFKEWLETRTNK